VKCGGLTDRHVFQLDYIKVLCETPKMGLKIAPQASSATYEFTSFL